MNFREYIENVDSTLNLLRRQFALQKILVALRVERPERALSFDSEGKLYAGGGLEEQVGVRRW